MWGGVHPGAEIQPPCSTKRCSQEAVEPFHNYVFTEMTKVPSRSLVKGMAFSNWLNEVRS